MLEIGTEKSSLWLATQSVIRTSRHLTISHLELAVLAFSASALFTYAASFNKPHGVQRADVHLGAN